MTDIVAPLTWQMNLDTAGFNVDAQRAGQTLQSLSRQFDQSAAAAARTETGIHKVGSSFRSTVVTMGALRFALMDLDDFLLSFPKSIAKVGGEFQKMQMLMQGLSKETDEVKRKAEGARDALNLIQMSKNAPFEIKNLSEVFVKLKSAGIDPAGSSMNALVDSVAKFGGSSEVMNRAAVAIQQMMGKSVVSMEELRQQLGEAIPNAMQLMARGLGLSMMELSEKVSKGTVKSSAAVTLMFMQMQIDAKGAAETMMTVLPGALARMRTQYALFEKTVAAQGFLSTLTNALNEITERLDSPGGERFAKSVGKGLNEVTESLVLAGRWIADNTDAVLTFGKTLIAVYGGSKMAGMFSAWRARWNEMAETQRKVGEAAVRNAEREIAAMQRKANAQERSIGQMENRRNAYQARLDERRAADLAKTEAAIEKELAKLTGLEKSRADLLKQRGEAEQRAVQKHSDTVAAMQRKVNDTAEKGKGVDKKLEDVTNQADAGIEAKQRAAEARRLESIDRVTAKQKSALEQLAGLQQRRDDALQAHKEQISERLARAQEKHADREEQISSKITASQEKIVQLEEKRARLAEQARDATVAKLEKEKRAAEAQLANVSGRLNKSSEAAISQADKDAQLKSFRQLETDKRLAHDLELRRIGEVQARRTLAEAGLKNELEKQAERAPVQPRGEGGRFIKGAQKEVPPLSATMLADNAARASGIASMHAEETAHVANARALGEEQKAAAKAGDAMARRAVGTTAEVAGLKATADALRQKIAASEASIIAIKNATEQDTLANGAARERAVAIDQQIAKQRLALNGHASELTALQKSGAAHEAALASSTANVRGIETEIASKQRSIQALGSEVAALNSAKAEKMQYSAATIAKIEALQAEAVRIEENLAVQKRALDVARNQQSVDSAAVQSIEKKIIANREHTQSVLRDTQALERHAAAVASDVGAGDAKIALLNRTIAADKESLKQIDGSTEALKRKAGALDAVNTGLGKAGPALIGFGKQLIAGVGWALAFEFAMQGVMWVFDQFTKKAREAESATQALIRARKGLAVEGDPETLEKKAKTNRVDAAQAERDLAAAQKQLKGLNGADGSPRKGTAMELRQVVAEISRLEALVKTLKTAAADADEQTIEARKTIAKNKVDDAVGVISGKFDKQIDSAINYKEYNQAQEVRAKAIEEANKAGNKKLAASLTAQDNLVSKELAARKVDIFKTWAAVTRDKNKGQSKEFKEALDETIRAKEKALKQDAARTMEDPNAAPKKAPKDHSHDKSPWATFMEQKRLEVGQLKTDADNWADGAITSAEILKKAQDRVASMVAADAKGNMLVPDKDATGKKVAPSSKEQAEAARLLASEETSKRIAKFRDSLVPAMDSLKAQEELYAEVFNGDYLFKPSSEQRSMDKVISELMHYKDLLGTPQGEGLKKMLDAAGLSFDDFVRKLRTMPADINLGKVMDDLNKKVRALEDNMVIDDRERQRIITKNRIEEEQARVQAAVESLLRTKVVSQADAEFILANQLASGAVTDETARHIRAVYAKLGSFVGAEQTSMVLKNRTAGEQMADDWANGMRKMETATAAWMNDFVDKIFDGKFKLKDFLMTAAKDTAKIQFKQVLATDGGLGPMLNGVTKGIGDLFGLKTPEKSMFGQGKYDSAGNLMVSIGGNPLTGATDATDVATKGIKDMAVSMKDSMTLIFNQLAMSMSSMMNSLGGGSGMLEPAMEAAASYFFKDGGIMTNAGSMSLRKYANGGIANKPQLAMFGEGSQPEAYVPLPDGRSIPVSLSGGSAAGAPAPAQEQAAPVVNVNVINQTGTQATASVGNMKFDGRQMILDVVLSAASQPGSFRDNFRTAAQK